MEMKIKKEKNKQFMNGDDKVGDSFFTIARMKTSYAGI